MLGDQLLPGGVKETIVLADASMPTHYVCTLGGSAVRALHARALADGSCAFFGRSADDPLFVVAPPRAADGQAGADRKGRGNASLDPSTVFPVELDPTITIQPVLDSEPNLVGTCPTCAAQNTDEIWIGGTSTESWRVAMQFDLGDDDVIDGCGGNDIIDGGDEQRHLDRAAGDDWLFGGAGNGTILARGYGRDMADGGHGIDGSGSDATEDVIRDVERRGVPAAQMPQPCPQQQR